MKTNIAQMTLAATIGVVSASATYTPESAQPQRAEIDAQLERIVESRTIDLRKAKEEAPGTSGVVMNGNNDPGLNLHFLLNMPEGRSLLEFDGQPTPIKAFDSEGTDLTKIEPGFNGEREYLRIEPTFGEQDAPARFKLHLAQTSRAATTFNLDTTVVAITFTGTRPHTIDVGDEWVNVGEGVLGDVKARVRFGEDEGFFGSTAGVTISPASVRNLIDDVIITVDGTTYESNGWSSDGRTVTYSFKGDIDTSARARVTMQAYVGIQKTPLRIRLAAQPLP